jgi:hypothetical protein
MAFMDNRRKERTIVDNNNNNNNTYDTDRMNRAIKVHCGQQSAIPAHSHSRLRVPDGTEP